MSRPGKRRNLFLTGMMGSGKTTVGNKLAERLRFKFIDTDTEIEKQESMPIAAIFTAKGELYFRQREKELLQRIVLKSNQVVATGGGMLADEENLTLAQLNGLVVFLSAPIEVLADRIHNSDDRPLLAMKDVNHKLTEIYKNRKRFYDSIEFQVDTSCSGVDEATREVESIFNQWWKQ